MKIKIALRGTLVKYFDGSKEDREVEVPENCTCDEALRSVGMDYTKIKSFDSLP